MQVNLTGDVQGFEQLKAKMYAKDWVVFAEKSPAGPERVIK